jgi:hypothetical protein
MNRKLKKFILVVQCLAVMAACSPQEKKETITEDRSDKAVAAADSIDHASGLVVDDELSLVVGNCTACHSAKLIAQNRATREGWKNMILWMQETQNLWDLGPNEDKILDYLARHYAPEKTGRRKNLQNIEWYELKEPGK